MEIKIIDIFGKLAENKDLAKNVRMNLITPALNNKEEVILNFKGVESTTQSFIHALISQVIKEKGEDILDKIYFKSCNKSIKKIIEIVVEYMQTGTNAIY